MDTELCCCWIRAAVILCEGHLPGSAHGLYMLCNQFSSFYSDWNSVLGTGFLFLSLEVASWAFWRWGFAVSEQQRNTNGTGDAYGFMD